MMKNWSGESIMQPSEQPIITSGFLLGCGFGGALEDLVARQILQLLTSSESYFLYQFIYIGFIFIAFIHLWIKASHQIIRNSLPLLMGGVFWGIGAYAIVEGIFNHFLLDYHHFGKILSREQQFYYDGLYLATGLVILFIGKTFILKGRDEIILYHS